MSTIIDSSNQLLLQELQQITQPALWFADESSVAIIAQAPNSPLLHIITNRYDIYQQGLQQQHNITFSDFNSHSLTVAPELVLYRISKERPLVHHLLNQAIELLSTSLDNKSPSNKKLFIVGQKNEGIKNYHQKLQKELGCNGTLKKHKSDYIGEYNNPTTEKRLDDNNYQKLRKIPSQQHAPTYFYSKPGLFGWEKVDQGSQLLLNTVAQYKRDHELQVKTILDLGCGYGWITLNAGNIFDDNLTTITATDNNAAALMCCNKNINEYKITAKAIAADCANTITEKFDLILCNPPFHQGFAHDQSLIHKFLHSTQQHLQKEGLAIFVVNEFIAIEKHAAPLFSHIDTIIKNNGFKVISLK